MFKLIVSFVIKRLEVQPTAAVCLVPVLRPKLVSSLHLRLLEKVSLIQMKIEETEIKPRKK